MQIVDIYEVNLSFARCGTQFDPLK